MLKFSSFFDTSMPVTVYENSSIPSIATSKSFNSSMAETTRTASTIEFHRNLTAETFDVHELQYVCAKGTFDLKASVGMCFFSKDARFGSDQNPWALSVRALFVFFSLWQPLAPRRSSRVSVADCVDAPQKPRNVVPVDWIPL